MTAGKWAVFAVYAVIAAPLAIYRFAYARGFAAARRKSCCSIHDSWGLKAGK
jgi:hypothetical protein